MNAEDDSTGRRCGQLRPLEQLRRVALWLPVILALTVVIARIDGYQAHIVRSGSMQPTFHVGDLTVGRMQPVRALERGEIVTFKDPAAGNVLVTHRLLTSFVDGEDLKVVTRGDANDAWETWAIPPESEVEVTAFSVPMLGKIVTDRWLLLAFGLLLFGLCVWLAVGAGRHFAHRVKSPVVVESRGTNAHRLSWLTTGWVAFGAVAVVVVTSSYSAWTAVDSNASNTFSTWTPTPTPTVYSFSSCGSTADTSLTVPAGKTSATVVVKAGMGGTASGAGGSGGVVTATFTVASGNVMNVYVGCAGANGSSAALGLVNGGTPNAAGGGGGASAVCIGACGTSANLRVVAGGGGGGAALFCAWVAGTDGGDGAGGSSGATVTPAGTYYSGTAGTSGGAAGAGGNAPPTAGSASGGAQGGSGGGGWRGGGGGATGNCAGTSAKGGGGGSSWIVSGATGTSVAATNNAAGSVSITLT